MTIKTKKLVTLATASCMALTATLAIPRNISTASASLAIEGVTTSNSYFGKQGLKYFADIDLMQGGIENYYTMPFAPWIPEFVDEGFSIQDGSLYTSYEDVSALGYVRYDCYYDDPSYEDDGGIIDDGITKVYPTFSFNYESSAQPAITFGIRFDGYWVCDVAAFDSLPLDFTGHGDNTSKKISFSYYTNDGSWATVNQSTTAIGDFFEIYPCLIDPYVVTKQGSSFCLIRDYIYICDSYGGGYASITCNSSPATLIDGVTPPLISEFTTTIINEAPPPVDIGELIWQPVESFLNTEFLPNFTFGNMCLLSLGLLLFGVFLKTFLGG